MLKSQNKCGFQSSENWVVDYLWWVEHIKKELAIVKIYQPFHNFQVYDSTKHNIFEQRKEGILVKMNILYKQI